MECEICGLAEAGSNGSCILCFFTGRYFEKVLTSDERKNVLTRIREIPDVVRAEVFHMGEGSFSLYVEASDGRIFVPGTAIPYDDTYVVMVGIPPVSASWAIAVVGEGQPQAVMPNEFDDETVVAAIKQTIELGNLVDQS